MATGEWGGENAIPVFRVNVQFRHTSQQCQTGFHIRDVGLANIDAEDVANAVLPWATTQFNKLLHQTDAVLGIDVVNLVTTEGFSLTPNAIAGTQPGTPCSPFLTTPISIKGNIRRRYGNGRMLWPIPSMESISGSQLVAAAQANVTTVLADLQARFMGDPLTSEMLLVHAHKALPGVGQRLPVPARWYDATSLRANFNVSSLRRRKAGVGS